MPYLAERMIHQVSKGLAQARNAAMLAQGYAILCCFGALAATAFVDRLTSVLLLLSTFLFAVVTRYSRRYLSGDPGQVRFLSWLCLTGTFVFALVAAENLLFFAIAWCGISLSLHHLLQYYRERPGAVLAARKKFLISRLGDAALAGALVLTYRVFGTWDFQEIFAAVERLRSAGSGNLPASIEWICGLLVFAALLKSAQFPFHSWLPDTMETPTPVSALMHAGIINAGGILIIRLSPLIAVSSGAMLALCLVGGFTALFASCVMLTQASIKRRLAFSTVGQMGFMMLECGLGAVHIALIHLVAHSLYKAFAFLSSGTLQAQKAEAGQRSLPLRVVLFCMVAALVVSSLAGFATVGDPFRYTALNVILSIALGQVLWQLSAIRPRPWTWGLGLVSAAILAVLYFGLEGLAGWVVRPVNSEAHWMGNLIAALMVLVAIAQTHLPALARMAVVRTIYVHARNGFYINTLANRMMAALWPAEISREEI